MTGNDVFARLYYTMNFTTSRLRSFSCCFYPHNANGGDCNNFALGGRAGIVHIKFQGVALPYLRRLRVGFSLPMFRFLDVLSLHGTSPRFITFVPTPSTSTSGSSASVIKVLVPKLCSVSCFDLEATLKTIFFLVLADFNYGDAPVKLCSRLNMLSLHSVFFMSCCNNCIKQLQKLRIAPPTAVDLDKAPAKKESSSCVTSYSCSLRVQMSAWSGAQM